jgi:hypothetical protein
MTTREQTRACSRVRSRLGSARREIGSFRCELPLTECKRLLPFLRIITALINERQVARPRLHASRAMVNLTFHGNPYAGVYNKLAASCYYYGRAMKRAELGGESVSSL